MTELRRTYERRTGRASEDPDREQIPNWNRPQEWNGNRRQNAGKRGKRPRAGLFVLLMLLAAVVLGGILLYRRFGPGTAWADYTEVYGAGAESTVVFCNGLQTEGMAVEKNGRTYLPEGIAAGADSKWYHSDEGLLLYSLADETVAISPSSHTYTAGGKTVDAGYELYYEENGIFYISTDFMEAFSGIRITSFPADEKENLPARVFLDGGGGRYEQAEAAGKTAVRVLAGKKSPILTKTRKGETLLIIDSVDDWTRVRTEDGFVGYLKTKYLENRREVERAPGTELPEYTRSGLGETVCMAWHQVFSAEDNGKLAEYLEGTEGLNVLSPTWFSVADNQGNLNSLADRDYVEQAHGRGLKVWGLVDDFDANVDDLALLSSTAARTRLTEGLMQAAAEYGLDGINVDFESVKSDSAPHFLQFIRELSIACRLRGLTLSIDNYVPAGGRTWYNLREQGQVADYVIIMGYDEHYKGCCAGTNASIGFSEEGIRSTLDYVPADKVVNGLPFFMRVWQETPKERAAADAKIYDDGMSVYEGQYARDSRAVGMDAAKQLLSEHGVTPQWQEELGQYYGQYEADGSTWRIWMEEAESIRLKLKKVTEYGIAGAAFWKLGLESADVWPVVAEWKETMS
ncbi:MAG: SH3 domain-containing protein [Lachnospiraceae bacterium]|jgi:spore germination protein YaaH|nr:SH3 domain-containing protein [Lachnospiraceae bacterium]